MNPITGAFELSGRFPGNDRVNDSKLTDPDVLCAKILQFLRQQICQVQLFARAGDGVLILGGLRIDFHVT